MTKMKWPTKKTLTAAHNVYSVIVDFTFYVFLLCFNSFYDFCNAPMSMFVIGALCTYDEKANSDSRMRFIEWCYFQ